MESLTDQVQAVLQELMPLLTVDGGGAELLRVEGDTAYLRLTGACVGCPGADITLKYGLESAITEAVPGIRRVLAEESVA